MDGLGVYLEKFRALLGDKVEEKTIVQEVVSQTCHCVIERDRIAIKNFTVSFSISPLERSEIMLHKKEIIALCKERGLIITDLR